MLFELSGAQHGLVNRFEVVLSNQQNLLRLLSFGAWKALLDGGLKVLQNLRFILSGLSQAQLHEVHIRHEKQAIRFRRVENQLRNQPIFWHQEKVGVDAVLVHRNQPLKFTRICKAMVFLEIPLTIKIQNVSYHWC